MGWDFKKSWDKRLWNRFGKVLGYMCSEGIPDSVMEPWWCSVIPYVTLEFQLGSAAGKTSNLPSILSGYKFLIENLLAKKITLFYEKKSKGCAKWVYVDSYEHFKMEKLNFITSPGIVMEE